MFSTLKYVMFSVSAFFLASVFSASSALAQVQYNYTGPDFNYFSTDPGPYTSADTVVGSLTFAVPLPSSAPETDFIPNLVSWSFTDGVSTLNTGNSFPWSVDVATSAGGQPSQWYVVFIAGSLLVQGPSIYVVNFGPPGNYQSFDQGMTPNPLAPASPYYGSTDYVSTTPLPPQFTGSWTEVTSVPEPETYAMMLAGLGVLGFLARRRKQKQTA